MVQWLLMLPIFLLVVLGGYEVWKAYSVRESLRSGTYQAARFLSINPDTGDWLGTIRDDFIVPELANNGLVGEEIAEQVGILAPQPDLECGETFIITAELPWRAVIPFVEREDWVMVSQYEGQVVCGP
ncbi:MAG: hypothetical protein PVF04_01770 [Anaerolineae bacterium]|jgi:hypothetical protein